MQWGGGSEVGVAAVAAEVVLAAWGGGGGRGRVKERQKETKQKQSNSTEHLLLGNQKVKCRHSRWEG